MTEKELQNVVQIIGRGVGESMSDNISGVVMLVVASVLAIARQPSIDVPKLMADLEELTKTDGQDQQGVRAVAPEMIRLLKLQLEK